MDMAWLVLALHVDVADVPSKWRIVVFLWLVYLILTIDSLEGRLLFYFIVLRARGNMNLAPNDQPLVIELTPQIVDGDDDIVIQRLSPSKNKHLLSLRKVGNEVPFDGEAHVQDVVYYGR